MSKKPYLPHIQGAPKVPAKCTQNKGKIAFFESQKFEISLARRFLLKIADLLFEFCSKI
jgi:hypothetical protein